MTNIHPPRLFSDELTGLATGQDIPINPGMKVKIRGRNQFTDEEIKEEIKKISWISILGNEDSTELPWIGTEEILDGKPKPLSLDEYHVLVDSKISYKQMRMLMFLMEREHNRKCSFIPEKLNSNRKEN